MSSEVKIMERGLALMRAGLTRRQLLRVLGISSVGVAATGLLAACATDDASDDDAEDVAAAEGDDAEDDHDADVAEDDAESEDDLDEEPVDDEVEETDDAVEESEDSAGDDERPELVVGVQGLPATLDAQRELSNVGMRVSYLMYDPLIRRDWWSGDTPGMGRDLHPHIAETWEFVDDVSLELTLRQDVAFHNGDPMSAEDVKYSFDRVIVDTPAELQTAADFLASIQQVDVVDDYTVHIITHDPDPTLIMRLVGWTSYAYPMAYAESMSLDDFGAEPITTGPYRLTEFVIDDRVVFEANDDYWDETPPASRVTLRVIPEVSARVAALVSGEVDIITNITPDQIETLESSDGVHARTVPLLNFNVLRYNTHNPVISDPRVRQAMNMSIDRELIVETLWSGNASVPDSHQYPDYGELLNEDRTPAYDPDRARELLEEAGYDGEEVVMWVRPDYYTLGFEAMQAIAQMWQEVGINAVIDAREEAFEFVDEAMVQIWSNTSVLADPAGSLWRLWGTESAMQREFWDAPERFNELGEEAIATLDQDFRYDAYQEMLDIWEEDAPGTVLYLPVETYGVRDGVVWNPYSLFYMDLRAHNLSFE